MKKVLYLLLSNDQKNFDANKELSNNKQKFAIYSKK